MTPTDQRLAALEAAAAEIAHNAAELARQIAFVNPGHEPTLELMATEMRAIADRLTQPREEAWKACAECSTPATCEEGRGCAIEALSQPAPSGGAEPSEEVLRKLEKRLSKEWEKGQLTGCSYNDLWPPIALAAWHFVIEHASAEAHDELAAIATAVLSADVDYPGGCALTQGRLPELVRYLAAQAEHARPASDPATVERITSIIGNSRRARFDSEEDWVNAMANAVAPLLARAVPEEIVRNLPILEVFDERLTYEEWKAIRDLLGWARTQPTASPPAARVDAALAAMTALLESSRATCSFRDLAEAAVGAVS